MRDRPEARGAIARQIIAALDERRDLDLEALASASWMNTDHPEISAAFEAGVIEGYKRAMQIVADTETPVERK